MLRARPITAVAVGGLLALAGCGSSGPSKSHYTSEADAICKSAQAQTAPLIKQIAAEGASLVSGGAASARRLATAVERLRTIAASDLAQLQALKQPSGDHAAIERFLTPLASVVGTIGQAASTLSAGQGPQALGLLEQVQPVAQQVTSAAQAYGVQPCGSILAALG